MNTHKFKKNILYFVILIFIVNIGLSEEFPDRRNSVPKDELIINTTSWDISSNKTIKSIYRNDNIRIVHCIFNPSNKLSELSGTTVRIPEWFVIDQSQLNIGKCSSYTQDDENGICWYEGDNHYGNDSSRRVNYVSLRFKKMDSGEKKNFSYILVASNDTKISTSNRSYLDLPTIEAIDGFGGKLSNPSKNSEKICMMMNFKYLESQNIHYSTSRILLLSAVLWMM